MSGTRSARSRDEWPECLERWTSVPINLSDFKQKRGREEVIDYGEAGSITFRWMPDRLTDEVWNAIYEEGLRDPFEMARRIVLPLVSWWDITDEGEPFPISVESVGSLGLFVVADIVSRIHQGLNETDTKKGSGGG